jgi:YfiH family protein
LTAPEPPPKADIILTDRREVTLVMRFADCVPILLYDPRRQAVALAHAGWRGTVLGTAAAAVEALGAAFGTHPADVVAAIGPAIGPDHYEIGPEVAAQVREAFGEAAERLLPRYGSRFHFDLWEANRLQLLRAGVPAEQIEVAALCTACHLEDWYSHRAERGRTGRFGALLALPRPSEAS